jgi:hypothetical protein
MVGSIVMIIGPHIHLNRKQTQLGQIKVADTLRVVVIRVIQSHHGCDAMMLLVVGLVILTVILYTVFVVFLYHRKCRNDKSKNWSIWVLLPPKKRVKKRDIIVFIQMGLTLPPKESRERQRRQK